MIQLDKREGKIWYNGELVNWQDVKLHVLSHGLHYASCVFEGLRVYDGEIFKLEEHTERLFHSAKRMDIKIPYSEDEINKSIKKSIEKIFKVNIVKINTIVLKGKSKIVRNKKIRKSDYKKAIVTLKKGQSIDLATGI